MPTKKRFEKWYAFDDKDYLVEIHSKKGLLMNKSKRLKQIRKIKKELEREISIKHQYLKALDDEYSTLFHSKSKEIKDDEE